jgi:hypothetical protein
MEARDISCQASGCECSQGSLPAGAAVHAKRDTPSCLCVTCVDALAVAPAAAEVGIHSFQVLHCGDNGYGGETASQRTATAVHRARVALVLPPVGHKSPPRRSYCMQFSSELSWVAPYRIPM